MLKRRISVSIMKVRLKLPLVKGFLRTCFSLMFVCMFFTIQKINRTNSNDNKNNTSSSFKTRELGLSNQLLIQSQVLAALNKKNSSQLSSREICIEKIKAEIVYKARQIIPSNQPAHLLDVPFHDNFGDSLIWLGEELLLDELNIRVLNRFHVWLNGSKSEEFLTKNISTQHTILLHGGGNFGDLYRPHTQYRTFIAQIFPLNTIVMLPQTLNYRNRSLALLDNTIYSAVPRMTIMLRSVESYESARELFPHIRSMFIPDMAFMIGNVESRKKPTVDIIILARDDYESQSSFVIWKRTLNVMLKLRPSFTYMIKDWSNYRDVKKHSTLLELPRKRAQLANEILSQGRVVITDRLHASIMSLLMGKPHVMVNEKYAKVQNTRESAFQGKPECSADGVLGYYASSIPEAVDKALELLKLL